MKKLKRFLVVFINVTFLSVGCSQKTEATGAVKSGNETQMAADSAALIAEKRKAADLEKGKLPKPYNPAEDAAVKISQLVKQAQAENKNIILQAGGNWCIWCLRFNNFVQTTPELKQVVDQNYLYYHLNYSPENKNEKLFREYGNPGEKFGYPVFIILDKNGNMIHIQDSAVLEDGKKGYSIEKVLQFLKKWTVNS